MAPWWRTDGPIAAPASPRGKTGPPARVLTMAASVGVCRTPVSRLFDSGGLPIPVRVLIADAARDASGPVLVRTRVTRLKVAAIGPPVHHGVVSAPFAGARSTYRCGEVTSAPRRDAASARRQVEKFAAGAPGRGGAVSPMPSTQPGGPSDCSLTSEQPKPPRGSSARPPEADFSARRPRRRGADVASTRTDWS